MSAKKPISKTNLEKSSISSSFEPSVRKTERTATALLMHWMRNSIEEKDIDIGPPDVETISDDLKMPDIVLYTSRRSKDALCVMEAKQPYFDVFNENELKEPARKKATERNSPYFAVTNFKQLIWYNTAQVNTAKKDEDPIIDRINLSALENLQDIEQTRYSEPIKRALEQFIIKLYKVYNKLEPEPKLPVDELLIFKLYEKIRLLSFYYKSIIDDRCHKDEQFARQLKKWFVEQGWSFAYQPQDFEKAARQTAYLLVNKILFYNILQSKRQSRLEPLEIREGLFRGSSLKKELTIYFDQVLEIDYQTVYSADFIDTIAFPEAREVVDEVKSLIKMLRRYDFPKFPYDIIGRIFERLIPADERHNLGQYFTRSDIVDLILSFCHHHEDDKILDPGCGAGTFLKRAYWHKHIINQRLSHEQIIDTLWGVDIAKFPAHLATINLAISDLASEQNYPNIIHEDFFAITSPKGGGFELPEKHRRKTAKDLNLNEREIIFPRWFNAIVGNPPYTRQEEIPETGVDKQILIENALCDLSGKKIANISKRAGIHAYFFVHGIKFLIEGGYFGFIVSNSWLDVEYGKGLQEFFLNNYKIIAIVESKVERWFEEADINTCIVILQKCSNTAERDGNIVRFAYLKKRLAELIPPADDSWEQEVSRMQIIDSLKKTILAHSELYENDDMRIYPKLQKDLWDEGFDSEEGKYIGAKWGKYLRAPDIFFTILEKGKDKFVPLKEIANIRRGFTTGANEFFYLTEEEIKRWGIEKEYWKHKDKKGKWIPNYVIKSPRECKNVIIDKDELKFRVLMIHDARGKLKGENIKKYIEYGERKEFDNRPTCNSRGEKWYELDEIKSPILSKRFIDIAFGYFLNLQDFYIGDTFFAINPYKKSEVFRIAAFLNSTLGSFFTEVYGRTVMGEGVLLIYGPEIVPMPILNPKLLRNGKRKVIKNILYSKIDNIFSELGASTSDSVSIKKIKPERRELDKYILSDILNLTEEEQLELYKAVIDLVKSRIERAKSMENNDKLVEGVHLDSFSDNIVSDFKGEQ